jgi:hypothetical protein
MARQEINLFIVENKDGRNEQFLPLFTAMNKAGYGKLLDKRYYIINSNMQVQQTEKATISFSAIQNMATMKGFNYVMYYLHEKV